ncbi:hypothetical protein WR25_17473 [Diploscapter pachys]|uniref:XdhC Rossmann domain-containing protein n=1 Tax=Diploscapter pachys TaxID=2018661 RepID=A0A2A2JWZ1_9BILA|nr:hypothetical protein WR25_17473 [Diploscapter pachys]
MPDDAVRAFNADLRTCIIAVSHDPKLDDLALLEALHSPAFYIGAIGSRRNSQLRRERLIEHFGETEQSLERLHGPIGIYIGSKTPAEIAVSVMAEVLAAKNAVDLPRTQLVHGQREVAHAPARGVLHGIGYRCSDTNDADLAHTLGAQFIDDVVRLVNEDNLDVTDIGVHRHVILRQVVVHEAPEAMVGLGMFLQGHAQPPDHSTKNLAAGSLGVDYPPSGNGADHARYPYRAQRLVHPHLDEHR